MLTGPDSLLLTHSDHSSMVVELETGANGLVVREGWDQRTIRGSYNVPVYHDGYLYGYNRRFLVCVDAASGETMWRSRPPGDGFIILVDGHPVLLTKDGGLHVVKADPEQYEEVASIELFDDVVWTHPSFANGHVYVRSQRELARVDVLSVARLPNAGEGSTTDAADVVGRRFEQFLREVEANPDRTVVVDRFLASIERFPLIEGENRVHFLYRGPAEDMAIAGDMIGARREQHMTHVAGTDLFYYSTEVGPDARVNYHFIRDYTAVILDPRNPRPPPCTPPKWNPTRAAWMRRRSPGSRCLDGRLPPTSPSRLATRHVDGS